MAGDLGVGRVVAQGAQEQRRHPQHGRTLSDRLAHPICSLNRSVRSVVVQPRGVGLGPRLVSMRGGRCGSRARPTAPSGARARAGRAHRLRPRPRPLRPRAARRHAARHARHAARLARRRHARRPGAGQPAGLPRARPRRPDARSLHPRGHEPGRRARAAHPDALPARDRQGRRHAPRRRRPRRAPGHRHARRRRRPRPPSRSTPTSRTSGTVPYDQIDRAKTVFEWGAEPGRASAGEDRRAQHEDARRSTQR